jgi:hypothetical protein
MSYSTIKNNSIDYKELCLSAVRAKLSYLSYGEIKKYWENYMNIPSDNIIYYIFENVKECPKYHCNINETAVAYSWIENRTLHIMFRGTNDSTDVLLDISICRTKLFPNNNSILVHHGFLEYFMFLEKSITKEINDKFNDFDIIQFNSHSLGAAAATIAATHYCNYNNFNKKIINYTFGSPRAGNQAFIKFYNHNIGINIRVRNKKDPVPLVPISALYNHVNDSICIGIDCNVKENITDDNWFIRLVKLPFQIYYRSPIYYHHCDVYIDNLLKISEWNIKYIKPSSKASEIINFDQLL